MKVVFLDVDGVLNSEDYYMEHQENIALQQIDEACVERLKRIVDATDATIVLSSSWRGGWDKNPQNIDPYCMQLVNALAKYGMSISDKTSYLETWDRSREVQLWLKSQKEKVDSFLILDDYDYNWQERGYEEHWIQTNFADGGLKEEHIEASIRILNRNSTFFERWKWKHS